MGSKTYKMSLSPSDAKIWAKCKSYSILKAIFDPWISKAAIQAGRDGTTKHSAFERAFLANDETLLDDYTDKEALLQLNHMLKRSSESIIDSDNIDGIGNFIFVEKKLQRGLINGRVDYMSLDVSLNSFGEKIYHFIVADYKTGHGYVDAKHNLQLILYAILFKSYVLDTFSDKTSDDFLKALADDRVRYTLCIIQPTLYHFDSINMLDDELVQYETALRSVEKELIGFSSDFDDSLDENAYIFIKKDWYSQGNHCSYCGFKAYCPRMKKLKELALAKTLSKDDKLDLLINKKPVEKLLDQLEQEQIDKMNFGEKSSIFEIKKSRTHKRFADQNVVAEAGKALGLTVFDQKIRTPANILLQLSRKKLETEKDIENARILQGQVYQPPSSKVSLVLKYKG